MFGFSVTNSRNIFIFVVVIFLLILFCATRNKAAVTDNVSLTIPAFILSPLDN